MARAKIVVVEDERIVALEIAQRLKSLGYEVPGLASSGEEAIPKIDEIRPDLVLMDIKLKGDMDGIDTAEQVRSRFGIPVVYLTAQADEDTLQRAKITEPYGYLLKPFEERELHTNIEMALYRSKMEKELKEQQQWLSTILKSIGDAVIATDEEGRVTFMNSVAEALTGWKQEEAVNRILTDVFCVIDEKTGKGVVNPVGEVVEKGIPGELTDQAVLKAKNGKEIHIENNMAPIRDDQDGINGAVLIFRDITRRKKVEAEIRDLKDFNENIVQNMTEGIILEDDNGIITFVNPAASLFLGYKSDELIGMHWKEIIPTDQQVIVENANTLRRGGKSSRYEVEMLAKSGRRVPVLVSGNSLGSGGLFAGSLAVFRDITQFKQAENEIEKRQKYLESVLHHTPDAIVTLDAESRITEWNPGAELVFGYSRDEVLGNNIHDLIAGPEVREEALILSEKIYAGEKIQQMETIRYRKDGSPVNVIMAASPIHVGNEKHGVVAVYTDITDQKRVEEELKQANEVTEEMNKELKLAIERANVLAVESELANATKSEFLANMSHEIRTPMNGIIGMTELTLDTELDSEQKDYLNAIQNSADLLMTVINDILDFSKIEAGRLDIEHIDFRLRKCIDETMQHFDPRAKNKGLELMTIVSPDIPDGVVGDPVRLRQIIINLVNNAIKFTDEGGIILEVVTEDETENDIVLHFSVSDSGIGIPEEKQEEIFLAFTQVDGSTTRQYGGTGLGLTICTKLVSMMGGRMWLESLSKANKNENGGGSIFHFTLQFGLQEDVAGSPALKREVKSFSQEMEDEMETSTETGESISIKSLRILLAEDNAINLKLAETLLRKKGWDVVSVTEGQKVLEALKSESFDLILMDVQMPNMDGFEATAVIREQEETNGCHIPVIAMTAHAMKGDREKCLKAGMDDYVSKPMKAVDLYSAIERVMRATSIIKEKQYKTSIDLSMAMEAVDGDRELLEELVGLFLEEYPKQLVELETLVNKNDYRQLERSAHSFKGAVGNFGAKRAFDLAYQLETLGKSSQLNEAVKVVEALKQEMTQLRQYFTSTGWENNA